MPAWPGKAILALAALVLAGCAFDRTGPRPDAALGDGPADWQAGGWYERSLQVGDTLRWYRLYFPPGVRPGAPAVVLLHGGSRSMRDMFGEQAGGPRAWLDVARDEGLVLVVPNGTNPRTGDTRGDNQFWADGRPSGDAEDTDTASSTDDIGFVSGLLDRVERRYPIDADRIYVSGASNGGLLTYMLLMRLPGRFAAGAAFIANLPADDAGLVKPVTPTPLLIGNGTDDRLMKWEGGDLPLGRGRIRSTPGTVDWWARANGVTDRPRRLRYLPDRAPDDACRLRMETWEADADGATVQLLAMEGGGHTLPSIRYDLPDNFIARRIFGNVCRDAEGARLAWTFMRPFRRDGERVTASRSTE